MHRSLSILSVLCSVIRDRRYIFLPLLLLSLVTASYAPGLRGDFIFDDFANLVRDENWRLTEWTPSQVARAVSYGSSSPSGRPLALLSFAANHYWFGADPYWLKAGNLLLHLINALLVWLLAHRLIGMTRLGSNARSLALWIAAAWALHPLQVSSVLYVVQRMEVGAATGTLLALYAYVRARTARQGSGSGPAWLAAAVLALCAGLLFKETTALAGGFALIIEIFLLKFRRSDGSLSKTWLAFYALGILSAFFVAAHLYSSTAEGYAIRQFTLAERLLTQGPVLTMYLGQILAPLPDSLRFYYDDFPVSSSLLGPGTALAWSILIALLALAWAVRKRMPLTSFGIAWFFVAHLITSSFIPLELAFEHRNYLAVFGVLLALLEPIRAAILRLGIGVGRPVAASLLLALAALTHVQALTWGSSATLSLALERRAPESQRAAYALGNQMYLAAQSDVNSPAWAMARGQWQHANGLRGDLILPLAGLIVMDGQSGIEIPPDIWRQLREKLGRHPLKADHINSVKAIVDCRVSRACTFDDQQLLDTLLALLEKHPNDLMLHMMYSNYAWNVLHERALALRVQRQAVALAPNDPGQRLALAGYLIASGDAGLRAEAIELVDSMSRADRDGRLSGALEQLRELLASTGGEKMIQAGGNDQGRLAE